MPIAIPAGSDHGGVGSPGTEAFGAPKRKGLGPIRQLLVEHEVAEDRTKIVQLTVR